MNFPDDRTTTTTIVDGSSLTKLNDRLLFVHVNSFLDYIQYLSSSGKKKSHQRKVPAFVVYIRNNDNARHHLDAKEKEETQQLMFVDEKCNQVDRNSRTFETLFVRELSRRPLPGGDKKRDDNGAANEDDSIAYYTPHLLFSFSTTDTISFARLVNLSRGHVVCTIIVFDGLAATSVSNHSPQELGQWLSPSAHFSDKFEMVHISKAATKTVVVELVDILIWIQLAADYSGALFSNTALEKINRRRSAFVSYVSG